MLRKLRKGDRVKNPAKPEWGSGIVLNDDLKGKVKVYFVPAGNKLLFTQYVKLLRLSKREQANPLLDLIEQEIKYKNHFSDAHHNVYVIELERGVLRYKRFRNANPQYTPPQPCVYVGMTGLTPEERFENHRKGYKSSFFPHKFGLRLLCNEFQHLNPMPYKIATLMESELARHLRIRGFAVWQN